jgi:hypothetical protein
MKRLILFLTLLLSVCSFATNARAITCFALTDDNRLLTFDSATPGIVTNVAITGVGAGYELVGMDVRTTVQTLKPANPGAGSLWAIGTNGGNVRIYVINPATAVANQIGSPLSGIDGSGSGNNGWFFGFDPGSDRIRIMNFFRSYLLDPNTITFQQQTNLLNFPALNGSAYETASFGLSSRIYFLDQSTDGLQTSADISTGVYAPVNMAGLDMGDFSLPAGLDVSGATMLAVATVGGTTNHYSVNRTTGLANIIGAISGNPTIRALTILPTSFPRTLPVTIKVKGKKRVTTTAAKVTIKGTARCRAGIDKVEYRVGKGKFRKAQGTTRWRFAARVKVGTTKIQVRAIGGNDVKSKPARVKVIRQAVL